MATTYTDAQAELADLHELRACARRAHRDWLCNAEIYRYGNNPANAAYCLRKAARCRLVFMNADRLEAAR